MHTVHVTGESYTWPCRDVDPAGVLLCRLGVGEFSRLEHHILHTMSTPMLMILKKYNVTQVIIKCFHVPPAVCLRTPRGTRTPGWESLD